MYCNCIRLWIIIFTLTLLFCQYECVLEWLFGQEETKEENKDGNEAGALVAIPFELSVTDEKFIAEAKNYGLQESALDICYHKVVITIRSSCHEMNEEDIGKFSVNLLNCQSTVEGRRVFPCTEKMTLGDCTKGMDPTTWNAYHIVSNRARAVCYAARQQQFTMKTEMTVNKLMSTTEFQLNAMKELQTEQERVGELTQKTFKTMANGQQDLMHQQEKLKQSQHNIHSFITGNMMELVREKAIIAAGQKELARMTENIKQKLDSASTHLQKNEQDRLSNHKEVLTDLNIIQSKAKEVWQKIENSTQRILQQHSKTEENYQQTLENLQLINETVSHLMQLMEHTRVEINLKLGWLTRLLDGAGIQLELLNSCVLHIVYFLIAAITASFVHAPYLSRVVLLLLVPLNAYSEIKQRSHLDFFSLSAIVIFSAAAQWTFAILYQFLKKDKGIYYICENKETNSTSFSNKKDVKLQCNSEMETSLEDIDETDILQNSYSDRVAVNNLSPIKCLKPSCTTPSSNYLISPSSNGIQKSDSLIAMKRKAINGIARDLFSDFDDTASSRSSRSSTPLRSVSRCSTPSKRICTGYNKSGHPCKNICVKGEDYCYRHYKQR